MGMVSNDTRMSPQRDPHPINLGVKNMKKSKNLDFTLSNDQTVLSTTFNKNVVCAHV